MGVSKVFSASDPKSDAIALHRDQLEDFPEEVEETPEPETVEETAEEAPEEQAPTPEEIREQVFADARQEVEAQVEKAYAEGFSRGEEAGRAAFEARIAQCADTLTVAADAMKSARESYLSSATPQILELTKLLCSRVLAREMTMEEDLLQRTAARAVEQLLGQEHMTIRVHPDDLAAMQEHKITLLESMDGLNELSVESDESVAPGGCVVDTNQMVVDARMEALLADMLEVMME